MPDKEPAPSKASDPNFVLPRFNAIHEGNWAEYEAQGFVPFEPIDRPDPPVSDELASTQDFYGKANVYTGDAWDVQAGRPLRHKPGATVYVRIEAGEERTAEVAAEMRRIYREEYEHRLREDQSSGGPASS
jgi:hypothetical protein